MNKKQQKIYFFQINFNDFYPSQTILKKMEKNSYLKIILTKQSTETMFISQYQTISTFKNWVKTFIYKGKISLSQQLLTFSIKSSDVTNNQFFILKLLTLNSQSVQSQLTYFKISINKYIEAKKLQGTKIFQEKFISKCSSRLDLQVYLQKNRAALQSIIADIKSQKRKRRSQSARKKSNTGKNLTIQQLFKQSQEKKGLKKSQLNPKFSKQKSKDIDKIAIQNVDSSPINIKEYQLNQQQCNKALQISQRSLERRNLQISKITQIFNSQVYTETQKNNILDSRFIDNVNESQLNNISRSRKTQQINRSIQSIHDKLQKSQNLYGGNQIKQLLQQESGKTKSKARNILSQQADIKSQSISSISSLSSSISRSSMEAIDLNSQESSLAHSSQISARSQLQKLHKTKNNFFKTLLIIFAITAIIYLLIPERNIYSKQQNKKHRKSKR